MPHSQVDAKRGQGSLGSLGNQMGVITDMSLAGWSNLGQN